MMCMETKQIQVCIKFMAVWGLFKTSIVRLADENGLTIQQVMVLYRLYTKGHILMGTLARQLHCDASNVTGMVDRLASQGYIERHELPEDRRAKQLVLTTKGHELVENLLPQLPKDVGLARFTDDELDMFLRLLGKFDVPNGA